MEGIQNISLDPNIMRLYINCHVHLSVDQQVEYYAVIHNTGPNLFNIY